MRATLVLAALIVAAPAVGHAQDATEARRAQAYDNLRQLEQNQRIGEVEEGITAAEAVGDDRLQSQATGRVMPDSFTHGSSAQRRQWFRTGYERGDMKACDTFAAGV